jgi:hypothetical protein
MLAILLGVTLPILYVVIGSAVGFRIYGKGVERNCKVNIEHGGGHHPYCTDCMLGGVFGAMFWPAMPLIWLGKRIGTKQRIFGFRARRMEKVAKHIAKMEQEIWGS